MRTVYDREAVVGCREDSETVLAENARLEAQLDGLHRALQSRATIEQAKGVLIAFARCTESEAFDLLVQLSQRRNIRLRVLAEVLLRMTATGFAGPDEDGLGEWLRQELVDLGERPRGATGSRNAGRPHRRLTNRPNDRP